MDLVPSGPGTSPSLTGHTVLFSGDLGEGYCPRQAANLRADQASH